MNQHKPTCTSDGCSGAMWALLQSLVKATDVKTTEPTGPNFDIDWELVNSYDGAGGILGDATMQDKGAVASSTINPGGAISSGDGGGNDRVNGGAKANVGNGYNSGSIVKMPSPCILVFDIHTSKPAINRNAIETSTSSIPLSKD